LGLNDYFFVTNGNVNLGSAWIVDAPSGTITFGTSNIAFAQFSQSQVYTANTAAGLSLTGTVFSAKVDNTTTAFDGTGNIIVKASANLTTPNIGAATGTSLSVTANVTGGNLLTGGLISATSTITSAANITGGNLLTGGLVSATANVIANNGMFTTIVNTASFTGGLVSVTGNVTANNGMFTTIVNVASHTGGIVSVTGNVTANNGMFTNIVNVASHTGAVVSVSGNVTGGNLLTGGLISATSTITSAANITGGNLLTAGLVSATGNVTGNFILGNGAFLTGVITSVANINNGTSNVSIPVANGNVQISVGGTSNVAVFATTGEYITGLLSVSGNVTGGNILTGGLISATANVTANNGMFTNIVNVASHTGAVVSVSGNVTGGNILTVGLISTTGNIAAGNILSNNYFYANGTPVPPGIIYTANTAPPTVPNPKVTDQWYNTSTDVLYQYLDDGTSDYWVDISSPAFAAGVVANVAISGSLLVNANATYDIGSSAQTFANVYAQNYFGNATSALYADLAENYLADKPYEPGVVLDFGGNKEVTISTVDSSRRVAGVVSTNPAHLMNSGLAGEHVVALALVGRVPVKVTGIVRKGDAMISAGNGIARADADPQVGTLIGKALEDFDGGEGTIEIVIGKH
jgi:hypothetical protein